MCFTFWDFKVVLQKCCHLPNSEFSSLLPVRTHVKVEPSWQTPGKVLSVQREEARCYLNSHRVIFIRVFTVWLETMVFTGNHTLTVTCFGKRLCLGNNPIFQHNLVKRFKKKNQGLIIKSCIEWNAMLWGLKSLNCWGDLKKIELFDDDFIESSVSSWHFHPSVLLCHHVCLVLTLWHPLSGWGQNLLHFMVWNKILLRKCCILKSFSPPSILTFQGECICKKQVWGVIWYVMRDCAFVCGTTAVEFF